MARIPTVLVLGLTVLALGVPSSFAATPATPYDTLRLESFDPQAEISGVAAGALFGQRMTAAGDLDRDGVGDVWISTYSLDVNGLNDVGRVYAVSGKTRALLYKLDSPEPQSSTTFFAGFGWSIANAGDIDGDGVNDLVVGSVRHDVNATTGLPCVDADPGCNQEQGKAWAFSGAPNKPKTPLYELNNPRPQAFAGFGEAGIAGDLVKADGTPGKDGIPELLLGAFNNDSPAGCGNQNPVPAGCRKDQGQAFIFNGALPGGRLVRTLDVPLEDRYVGYPTPSTCVSPAPSPNFPEPIQQRCGALGAVNESIGDLNNDGFADQSVTAWTTGVSTAPGAPACFGPPEVPDPTCNQRQGRIYIYSGKDGSLIRKIDDPVPFEGALFGLSKRQPGAPGDVNGDGYTDIYGNGFLQAGPSRNGQPPKPLEGRAWIFSGKDAVTGSPASPLKDPLFEIVDPTPEAFASFGFSLVNTDYNGDGRPDLYVSSFAGTYVFSGDGALQKTFDLSAEDQATQPPGNTSLGFSIAAPGDLNGDCDPDYIAGSPGYDVPPNANQGRVYYYLSSGPASCPASAPGAPGDSPSPGSSPAAPDKTAPSISSFGLSNRRFALGRGSTPLSGNAARAKKGTTFKYTLSEAATAKMVIAQRRPGRRKGKRCVAPTRTLNKAKKCTRITTKGTLTRTSKQGPNKVVFSGRIGSKALKPGKYQATLTAIDAAKNTSKPKTIAFTVVKR